MVGYHGTSKENAEKILRDGFKPWCYFAAHLEDAIGYGGPYVFAVFFGGTMFYGWQRRNEERIPPSRIISLTHYEAKRLHHNKTAHRRSRKWFARFEPCGECGGAQGGDRPCGACDGLGIVRKRRRKAR